MFKNKSCECTAFLLQDVGLTGPDGPDLLRKRLKGHSIFANSSKSNKSRSVVIIVHKSWQIDDVFRDSSGCLVGVVISKGDLQILLISAYLPPNLDIFGSPLICDIEGKDIISQVQQDAHEIYSSIREWSCRFTHWIVGGDLNETRSPMDSIRVSSFKEIPKFVDEFLDDSEGVDVWRSLYPHAPGLTYKSAHGASSRIDYFLLSASIFAASQKLTMRIANWLEKQDHARISLCMQIPISGVSHSGTGKPWSIPQPRLFNLTDSNRARCKTAVQEPLDDLLSRFLDAKGSNTPLSLDFLSGHTSEVIIDQVCQILGSKSSTHKKGKYLPNDVCRTQCLISTITKGTDLIRTLFAMR